jgi:hypothetical protein
MGRAEVLQGVREMVKFPNKVDAGLRGLKLWLFGGEVAEGGVKPLTVVVSFEMGLHNEQVCSDQLAFSVSTE